MEYAQFQRCPASKMVNVLQRKDHFHYTGERLFQTPWGNRIVDAYNSTKKIIAEAKYGYQGLSEFIKTEILRDAWLLETGKGGPSAPLLEALLDAGIKVVFH